MARPAVVRILGRLARHPTAPFHEHAVAREAAQIARESGANVRTDDLGNLIVTPPGRRRGPLVYLVAHMDHPGFEVVRREEAHLLGGIRPTYLRRGVKLRFYHDGRPIAATLRRVTRGGRQVQYDVPPGRNLLRRGDFGVLELTDFRVAGGRVHARQIDDLAGCAVSLAVMTRAAKKRGLNVRALLTRAEEVGLIGTTGAASDGLLPRRAWIVNVEASKAIPGVDIGGGPVIRVGDRARTFDRDAEALLAVARDKIGPGNVQRALMTGGVCEATAWTMFGYRATGVAIPLGNYHNQGPGNRLRPETVAVRDLATAVDLIELAVRHAPSAAGWDRRRRGRIERLLRQHRARLEASRPRV